MTLGAGYHVESCEYYWANAALVFIVFASVGLIKVRVYLLKSRIQGKEFLKSFLRNRAIFVSSTQLFSCVYTHYGHSSHVRFFQFFRRKRRLNRYYFSLAVAIIGPITNH